MPLLKVFKSARCLELWVDGALAHTFAVALGRAPVGQKEREGDGRTPEGTFYVCTRNAQSRFHRFLGLSYPNAPAAARGLAEGRLLPADHAAILDALARGVRPPWDTPLGGQIGIHGHGTDGDWTAGCVALADADMDVLWEVCPLGTPVVITP